MAGGYWRIGNDNTKYDSDNHYYVLLNPENSIKIPDDDPLLKTSKAVLLDFDNVKGLDETDTEVTLRNIHTFMNAISNNGKNIRGTFENSSYNTLINIGNYTDDFGNIITYVGFQFVGK